MLDDRRVKIFLITLAIALTAGVGIKAFVKFKQPSVPLQNVAEQAPEKGQEMVVYVTGAVVKQGLVRLPLGARLADALASAGQGADADLANLNLAEKLKDGQKIVVPKIGDISGQSAQPQSSGGNSTVTGGGTAVPSKGKININTASAKELDELPGIGPTMAERIITYRTQKGAFVKPEDLKEVPGIGDKKYADLEPLITVN